MWMVPIESSTYAQLANVKFKAIQRQTLPYVAVKDGHPLFSSIYESTCCFCRVCTRRCEVHTQQMTLNKATFIHKNKNFLTATLLQPETACHVYIVYWRNRHKRCRRVPSIVTSWLLSSALEYNVITKQKKPTILDILRYAKLQTTLLFRQFSI